MEIDLKLFITPEPWQNLQGLAVVFSPPHHVPALAQQTWISWGQVGGVPPLHVPWTSPLPMGAWGCLHRVVSRTTLNEGQSPNAINWEMLLACLDAASLW